MRAASELVTAQVFEDTGRSGVRLQAALCALELLMPAEPSP